MANDDLDRVIPMDQLKDFELAGGAPDVRGWEVLAADGRRIGKVNNLLVDPRAMKVRYLDVGLAAATGLFTGSDRHVLIPIGYARLDERGDQVVLDELATRDLSALPPYARGAVSREDEAGLRRRFDPGYARPNPGGGDADFYAHDLYDDRRFYGPRRGQTANEAHLTLAEEELAIGKRHHQVGEVGVHKHVETERVREEVPVTREEVSVERRPVTGDYSLEPQISGDEIRIPILEEELVVQKRQVVREELVIRKRRVTETRVVEADLRKERAEVQREGDVSVREE